MAVPIPLEQFLFANPKAPAMVRCNIDYLSDLDLYLLRIHDHATGTHDLSIWQSWDAAQMEVERMARVGGWERMFRLH